MLPSMALERAVGPGAAKLLWKSLNMFIEARRCLGPSKVVYREMNEGSKVLMQRSKHWEKERKREADIETAISEGRSKLNETEYKLWAALKNPKKGMIYCNSFCKLSECQDTVTNLRTQISMTVKIPQRVDYALTEPVKWSLFPQINMLSLF